MTVAPAALANYIDVSLTSFSCLGHRLDTHLQAKNGNTAGSLNENSMARSQRPQAIKGIPRRQTGAGKRRSLSRIEVLWRENEALLAEDAELAQRAIIYTSKTGLRGPDINIAVLMALVEQGHDIVALLEEGDL